MNGTTRDAPSNWRIYQRNHAQRGGETPRRTGVIQCAMAEGNGEERRLRPGGLIARRAEFNGIEKVNNILPFFDGQPAAQSLELVAESRLTTHPGRDTVHGAEWLRYRSRRDRFVAGVKKGPIRGD